MISRKNNIHIFSLMSLVVMSQSFAENALNPETLLADHVSHRYLISSFGEEKPIEGSQFDENSLSFFEKIRYNFNKQFDTKKQTLTPYSTQKIAFTLIQKESFNTEIIDSSFIDKLEIVGGGENSQQHLFGNVFNNLQTALGKTYATLTFCSPTTDITLLRNRQQALSCIISNKNFINTSSSALKTIAHNENKSLQSWDTVSPVNADLLK